MLARSRPPGAAQLNIVYPMVFKVTNSSNGLATHCGVLEFTAEEGRAYLPGWVRTQLKATALFFPVPSPPPRARPPRAPPAPAGTSVTFPSRNFSRFRFCPCRPPLSP